MAPPRTMVTPARSTTAAMGGNLSSVRHPAGRGVTYGVAMDSLPALRLTVALNAMINTPLTVAEAVGRGAGRRRGPPRGRPGRPAGPRPGRGRRRWPTRCPLIAARESEMWVLALPVPGAAGRAARTGGPDRRRARPSARPWWPARPVSAWSRTGSGRPCSGGCGRPSRPAPPPSPPEADGRPERDGDRRRRGAGPAGGGRRGPAVRAGPAGDRPRAAARGSRPGSTGPSGCSRPAPSRWSPTGPRSRPGRPRPGFARAAPGRAAAAGRPTARSARPADLGRCSP